MPPIKLFYIFLSSLMTALLIMPSLYNISIKVGGVDFPDNRRKHHEKAVPRIGGIAILCGSFISILLFNPLSNFLSGLITGGLIIFSVGFIDDLRGLTPLRKLAGQIIGTSVGIILSQNYIQHLGNPFSLVSIELPFAIAVPFTIFCIVGLINALNMIDGLDGLAGGVTAIACMALAVLAFATGALQVIFASISLLGAVIGFMTHNTYPARIFMGDSGSNLLGFSLGMIAVKLLGDSPSISPVVLLVILFVPVFDTLYVIADRLISGRPVMGADNLHIHHRLVNIGLGHKAAVLTVYGWSYFMAAVAVFFYNAKDSALFMFVLLSTAVFYLILFIASKYWLKHNGRKSAAQAPSMSSLPVAIERLSEQLIIFARYLIVFIMATTAVIDLDPVPLHAVVAAVLLCSILLTIAFKHVWLDQMLLISLYLTGVYLIFEMENFGRSAILANVSYLTFSAYFFTLLAAVIGIYILIRKRFNLLMDSAIEFSVLLAVIFIPLLPDSITGRYHLLTVAGKSIILFAAYKLILLSKDTRRNRVVILASILALLAILINRIF